MVQPGIAKAIPWPDGLCHSGALVTQLQPLKELPCWSNESEEEEPAPFHAVAVKEEDDDDEDGDHSSPTELTVASVPPSPTSPCDEQSHKKAAVSARLAQMAQEDRAQAAVATLKGCVHLRKVTQKAVDLTRWFKGVHQIVLWVGTSRQGKGARKGSAKGKGKGAGAAVAERNPKGKSKGKKW